MPPRKRASTLGVISELPNQEQSQSEPQQNRNNALNYRSRIPSTGSSSNTDGSLPVVAGTHGCKSLTMRQLYFSK